MAKLDTARDIMKTPVITVKEDMQLIELIKIMASNHITGLPVVDDDEFLVGMISWRLIMNLAIVGEAANLRVSDAMSKSMEPYGPICSLNTPVKQLLARFSSYRINRIVVVDDNGVKLRVLGIICRSDLIKVMDQIYS